MEVIKVVFVTGLVRNIHSSLRNSAITKNVAQLLAGAVKMTRFPPPSDNTTALIFPVPAESNSWLLQVSEIGDLPLPPVRRIVTRVLTVPQHVQDVGLTAVSQLLHVVLLAGKRHDVVGGSQHEGGLEISHDLLPDCSLHGEMSLDVFDILFSQCLTAPPLLQCLVDHLLPPPLLLVLLPLLLLELVITGAHGHGAVCLRLLQTRTSHHAICLTLTV